MSCSCSRLRGVIDASKGTKWIRKPAVESRVLLISSPFSTGFLMSKMANVCAIMRKIEVSTIKRLGQTLRPKPKLTSPGSRAPGSERNRSGSKSRGLGYIVGSLLNDLDIR